MLYRFLLIYTVYTVSTIVGTQQSCIFNSSTHYALLLSKINIKHFYRRKDLMLIWLPLFLDKTLSLVINLYYIMPKIFDGEDFAFDSSCNAIKTKPIIPT